MKGHHSQCSTRLDTHSPRTHGFLTLTINLWFPAPIQPSSIGSLGQAPSLCIDSLLLHQSQGFPLPIICHHLFLIGHVIIQWS